MSEFAECIKRQHSTRMAADGSETHVVKCTHLSCDSLGKEVTPAICAGCPLRVTDHFLKPPGYKEKMVNERDFGQPTIKEDGTIVYPRTGFEPPVCPTGYYRQSDNLRDDGAWTFIPLWPPCADRTMANTVRPCGCVSVNMMCGSEKSEFKGLQVIVPQCIECPVRRAQAGSPATE